MRVQDGDDGRRRVAQDGVVDDVQEVDQLREASRVSACSDKRLKKITRLIRFEPGVWFAFLLHNSIGLSGK